MVMVMITVGDNDNYSGVCDDDIVSGITAVPVVLMTLITSGQ